ncbi:methylglutaconyl-CoA hydratase [Winogradskyella wandonensis]|uniref:Methylglutaconyl-CoA hydratase n=2 Tax=Winogradskyella TaxID=286104 RepID=A0A4R1KLW0_9FLAO|nr:MULTISPECIES: enoyl-CoA hydratase/isomerase family protein [Winogradskyella]TCK65240.1 methylglutaconyl-CoA hydratase [Winogradskyella wandonensis]SHH02405.1 methylglutaconyl-CoA hydratase [Winogradskyella jejuensis]
MAEQQPYVKQTIENEVGYIEFFHPAHNSLPGDVLTELANTITEAGKNDAIKVIVLKSGGDRTFCAGASFNELININDAATGKVFFSGFANVINAMRKCPKFIIGRIQGKTVGGGVGLAASTDYCMATKFAAIKLSELNIGIGPFVVGPAIERKIGLSAMSQIAIDANSFYPAEWAKQKGLFTHVFESTEALDEAVKKTAEHLCTYNTEAMLEMKKVFWKGTDDWDELLAERAATSGRLVLSDFTKEKLKEFK